MSPGAELDPLRPKSVPARRPGRQSLSVRDDAPAGRARPSGDGCDAAAARSIPRFARACATTCTAVRRPHPAISHFTNLLGATLALRQAPRHAVAIAGSYDAALGAGLGGCRAAHAAGVSLPFGVVFGVGPGAAVGAAAAPALHGRLERRVFALSSRIVAVSEFSARQIHARAPARRRRRSASFATGVDTDYFRPPPSKATAHAAIGLDPDVPLVLGVGRLAGVKQFDRLITASRRRRARPESAPGDRRGWARTRPTRRADRHLWHGRLHRARRLLRSAAAARFHASRRPASVFERVRESIAGDPRRHGVRHARAGHAGRRHARAGGRHRSRTWSSKTITRTAWPMPCRSGWPTATRLDRLGARARELAVDRYDWERVVDGLEAVCSEIGPGWR